MGHHSPLCLVPGHFLLSWLQNDKCSISYVEKANDIVLDAILLAYMLPLGNLCSDNFLSQCIVLISSSTCVERVWLLLVSRFDQFHAKIKVRFFSFHFALPVWIQFTASDLCASVSVLHIGFTSAYHCALPGGTCTFMPFFPIKFTYSQLKTKSYVLRPWHSLKYVFGY